MALAVMSNAELERSSRPYTRWSRSPPAYWRGSRLCVRLAIAAAQRYDFELQPREAAIPPGRGRGQHQRGDCDPGHIRHGRTALRSSPAARSRGTKNLDPLSPVKWMNAADLQRRHRSARANVQGDERAAALRRGGGKGEGVKWHGSNVRSAGDSSCRGARTSQAGAARAAVRGYGNTVTASPPGNSKPRPCSWRCGSNSSGWLGSSGGAESLRRLNLANENRREGRLSKGVIATLVFDRRYRSACRDRIRPLRD